MGSVHDHHREPGPLYLYTDSWAVYKGMTQWMAVWHAAGRKVHDKPLWGYDMWPAIWDACSQRPVAVHHVDAHLTGESEEARFNREVDDIVTVYVVAAPGLAKWIHQKSGHLGGEKAMQWATVRGLQTMISA
ncbi:unnamed protein product [Natator depressus]